MDVSSLPVSWTRVDSIWAKVAGFQRSIEVIDSDSEKWKKLTNLTGTVINITNSKTSFIRTNQSDTKIWNTIIYLNAKNKASIMLDAEDSSIMVKDAHTPSNQVDLCDYPINWSALQNVPSKFQADWGSTVTNKPGTEHGTLFLYSHLLGNTSVYTILVSVAQGSTSGTVYNSYYLNQNGTWTSAPSDWATRATKLF